jgi:hypothetical protein
LTPTGGIVTATAIGGEARIGRAAYVVGGLSFIPLLGIVFAVIAIVWGLAARRRGGGTVALLGAAGIGFTVLLYGGLFYFGFVQRDGIYDELRVRLAQQNLNMLVQSIEYYKVAHGEYPDSLETLRDSEPKNSFDSLRVFDPRMMKLGPPAGYFYYRRVDADHYYLRGVAPDGKPFSPGALLPQVGVSGGKIGLLTDAPRAAP